MNQVQEWVNTDKNISDILAQLQNSGLPIAQQAEMAFHQIAALCNLYKMPGDIPDDENSISVYQILGMLKYLQPGDDLRGLVLSAIYYAKNGYDIDLDEVLKKKFGRKIPKGTSVGFIGENSDVEIIFIDDSQNWFDMGCKLMLRNN